MTATIETVGPVYADLYDGCRNGRYLLVQQRTGHGDSTTIAHVRLTRGAKGKGTWQEVEEHLAAIGYQHTGGWRKLSTCLRSKLTAI